MGGSKLTWLRQGPGMELICIGDDGQRYDG